MFRSALIKLLIAILYSMAQLWKVLPNTYVYESHIKNLEFIFIEIMS